jgi:hypothetical protein
MDAASSREDRRNWCGSELFLVFRDANARTLFAFLALSFSFFSLPFLVRSFWFFFGNVLSFSSPTTSGRSFLEQGSEESVFFPTQFLFFRDATSLVSEHSLCLFPWRFWFFFPFLFRAFRFKRNERNINLISFSSPTTTSGRSFLERGAEESFSDAISRPPRDTRSLVSEHSICLPCRFWLLSLFHFFH